MQMHSSLHTYLHRSSAAKNITSMASAAQTDSSMVGVGRGDGGRNSRSLV